MHRSRFTRFGIVVPLGLVATAWTASAGIPAIVVTRFPVPANAQRLQVADLDGDGDRDLLVLAPGRLQSSLLVLRNDGSGGFTNGWSATLPAAVFATQPDLDIADLDLDGDIDLVLQIPGAVSEVRRNDGAGNFATVVPLTVPGQHVQTAIGLLDGDAVPDLAVYSLNPTSVLSGWQGLGNGSFVAASSVPVANDDANARIHLADMSGDGKLDLVRAGSFGVHYFAGQSTSGFPTFAPPTPGWTDPCGDLEVAHLDGDARLDIVVTIPQSGAIEVFHGMSGGSLLGPAPFPGNVSPGALAVGDLDQDNNPDVIVASESKQVVSILPGGPNAVYLNPWVEISGLRSVSDLLTADLDGDGDLDVAGTLRGGFVAVLENKLVP